MRKQLLTILASAALVFGIAGQASAGGRDYHGGGHNRHYERHYNRGHHDHRRYDNHHRHHRHYNHNRLYRPYYNSGYYYGPPAPYYPAPYYGGYGVSYSQPGFGVYIGR